MKYKKSTLLKFAKIEKKFFFGTTLGHFLTFLGCKILKFGLIGEYFVLEQPKFLLINGLFLVYYATE